MENCADMDNYQFWAWNDLNCETAQANVILFFSGPVQFIPYVRLCDFFCMVLFNEQCSSAFQGFQAVHNINKICRVSCARCLQV